jgi:NAD(P)H-dependent FMN reductase
MVGAWVVERARAQFAGQDIEVELVDIAEAGLPLLDEPVPAAIGDYSHAHTRRWAQVVNSYDGFVFVVPEYNHSVPAATKNAIDYLFAEWHDKSAGFVSYGIDGGTRAVEHLRLILAELKVGCVRSQVPLGLFTDFELDDATQPGRFTPAEHREPVLLRMLDEVAAWAGALRPLRLKAHQTAPPS